MSLRARNTAIAELMDDPDCDSERLAATLRRFETVNRLISGWGTVYRTRLRPHLRDLGRPARVLDVGCGGGDLVMRLAAYAARDGLDVEWLGIDPDERALSVASERRHSSVSFRQALASDLCAEGAGFDAVVSNHVLHHLHAEQLRGFASDSLTLSTGPVLHADIARGRLAYALYTVGITPLAPGTFLRTDGLRSIRRSYRPDELAGELAATGSWRVEQPAPFRLLAVGTPGARVS